MSQIKFALVAIPLLWSAVAMAENSSAQPPQMPSHEARMCGGFHEHKDDRLARLETRLRLTDAQRTAWDRWRQADTASHAKLQDACLARAKRDQTGAPTILDREADREQMLSLRLEGLRSSRQALQAFYDSLNPEQRAVLDTWSEGHGHEGGHHGGHHRMG